MPKGRGIHGERSMKDNTEKKNEWQKDRSESCPQDVLRGDKLAGGCQGGIEKMTARTVDEMIDKIIDEAIDEAIGGMIGGMIDGMVDGIVDRVLGSMFRKSQNGSGDDSDEGEGGGGGVSNKSNSYGLEELLFDLAKLRCDGPEPQSEPHRGDGENVNKDTHSDNIAVKIAYDEDHPFWCGGVEFDASFLNEVEASFILIYALAEVLAAGLGADVDEISLQIMKFVRSEIVAKY